MNQRLSRLPGKVMLAAILVFALTLPVASWAATGNPNAKPGDREPERNFSVEYNVEIMMRDGVIAKADLYMPDGDGPWPTVIISTIYSKTATYFDVEWFPKNGYVCVYRDTRGRFESDGDFVFSNSQERHDQYDTIDWIINQEWSNGKVAAWGGSALGQTTMAALTSGHPNLICAAPYATSEDVWRDGWYYRGGAMELGFISKWGQSLMYDTAPRYIEGDELVEFLDNMAFYEIDQMTYTLELPVVDFSPMAVSADVNLFKNWVLHPTWDEYWIMNSHATYVSSINLPILHTSGWYDIFGNGAVQAYTNAKNFAYTELARDNQYLFMNPRPHGARDDATLSMFGEVAIEMDMMNDVVLPFFDYWMKDLQHSGFDPNMHVLYYTMGDGGKWTWAADWPLPNVQETPYYLNSGKSGTINSLNDGALSSSLPAVGTAPQTYVYDPMNPISTRGGNTLIYSAYGEDGVATFGPQEQTPIDQKSLTFTSQPLESNLEISGKVLAVLYASSDAVDTDWVVRLNDVAPDGTSINVVDGILRARKRNKPTKPILMNPGEVYEFEIDLWSTSYIFKEGHCLRVTVNSSSFPRWSRNLNVAEFPEQATEWVVANNTIYLDPERPSHIILPVIPR